jgi:fermentation-respiration switch protein FrsA (DUF1100 family)
MLKPGLELLGVILLLVIVLAAAIRLFEPRFAFFPTSGETATPLTFGVAYEPFTTVTADGQRLHGWSMKQERPRATVVYFHGNGGNLSIWAPILAGISRRQFSVIAFDYRGYGMSTGSPSEKGLHRDVEAIVSSPELLSDPDIPIVYWGRSLGVAMAAHAAARRPPHGLILEAGFPDARSLLGASPMAVVALLSSYRFSAADTLRRLTTRVPVLVLHGDADEIIPIAQGRALFDRLAEPKQFVPIRGGTHNDQNPADPDAYWSAVDRFIATIDRSTLVPSP